VALSDLVPPLQFLSAPAMSAADALQRQAAVGMGLEDAQMVVEGMAMAGVEPTYCMGDDNPLAVLSDKPHMLYTYFKQRFAQVSGAGRDWTGGCCMKAHLDLRAAAAPSDSRGAPAWRQGPLLTRRRCDSL